MRSPEPSSMELKANFDLIHDLEVGGGAGAEGAYNFSIGTNNSIYI